MKKRIQKMIKNEKGLTLVELLAVIVILGIIAAIAVPSIGKIIENTKYNAVKADAVNALNAANLYFAEDSVGEGKNNEVTIETLEADGYLENTGKLNNEDIITRTENLLSYSGTVIYSGTKDIQFNNATLASINADKQKGSSKEKLKAITSTLANP